MEEGIVPNQDKMISYPARPTNGGPIDKVTVPKKGKWFYEPKYNGWRALIHVPTGRMWNRHGEPLTIESHFKTAISQLQETDLEWADCEALERRHSMGRGSLIVFHYPMIPNCEWFFRKLVIEQSGLPNIGDLKAPPKPGAYTCPVIAEEMVDGYWQSMKEFNELEGCEFFEGLVAKKADSKYPLQLRSPNEKYAYWIKHRYKA